MVRGIGIALTKAIGRECNKLCLRIYEIHLLRTALLRAKAGEACGTGLWLVLLGLDAVQDVLSLSEVVDACIVAPTVRGKDEGGDEIELTIAGCALGIARAIGLATPGEITLADAVLMLHVCLGPAPQTIEDILLAKLDGNHQTIGHTLGAGVVIFHIGNIAHRVAYFEIDFVRTTKHVVEHLLEFGIDFAFVVTHLYKQITVLTCLKRALLPRGKGHHGDGKHHQGCQNE